MSDNKEHRRTISRNCVFFGGVKLKTHRARRLVVKSSFELLKEGLTAHAPKSDENDQPDWNAVYQNWDTSGMLLNNYK